MSAFSTPKTTALAPMANASVNTAAIVNPGDLRSWRRANRRSCNRVAMVGLRVTVGLYGKKRNSRAKVSQTQVYANNAVTESRRRKGTELRVRFRRGVFVNEQGGGDNGFRSQLTGK